MERKCKERRALTAERVREQRTANGSRRETTRRAEHHVLSVLALVRLWISVLLLRIRPVLLLRVRPVARSRSPILWLATISPRRSPVLRLATVLRLLVITPAAKRPRPVTARRGAAAVPLVLRPLPLRPRRRGLGVVPPRLRVVVQR